jgi:hypothetical protein
MSVILCSVDKTGKTGKCLIISGSEEISRICRLDRKTSNGDTVIMVKIQTTLRVWTCYRIL